jgi:glycosyltransferase involved in cell wall biosynthesis
VSTKPVRIAYFVTHPIQYQVPLLRMIAADPSIELKVFYSTDFSKTVHFDPGFGRKISWEIDLLAGYDHEVLPAFDPDADLSILHPLSYGVVWRLVTGRFDVVWCHSYARLPHLVAIVAGRLLGRKVFLRDDASRYSSNPPPFKAFIKSCFMKTLNLFLSGVLTIGSLNREYYRNYGIPDRKLFPMRYAVDNDWFRARIAKATEQRETLRLELGLDPDQPVILFAGKFQPRKRGDDLIRAFAKIANSGDAGNARLVIVGDGEMNDAWRTVAGEAPDGSVIFTGFKGISELPAYFDLCDVFVIPSAMEPWGLIVNEVMNAAKPLIATDEVTAAYDLMEDGKNGYVVKTGDIDDMAGALIKILSDRQNARTMGARSLEVISDWSFERNVMELKTTLRQFFGDRVE